MSPEGRSSRFDCLYSFFLLQGKKCIFSGGQVPLDLGSILYLFPCTFCTCGFHMLCLLVAVKKTNMTMF